MLYFGNVALFLCCCFCYHELLSFCCCIYKILFFVNFKFFFSLFGRGIYQQGTHKPLHLTTSWKIILNWKLLKNSFYWSDCLRFAVGNIEYLFSSKIFIKHLCQCHSLTRSKTEFRISDYTSFLFWRQLIIFFHQFYSICF